MKVDSKYWYLEDSFNLSKRIGRMDMEGLCDVLEMKIYEKGSSIHEPFENNHLIYFIKKGHVKIGRKIKTGIVFEYSLGKGNIFGESRITINEEFPDYMAIAMSECAICFIEVAQMQELMWKYPKLNNYVYKLAGLKFKKIERKLSDILYKDAETRIKDFIEDFVLEHGKEKDEWLIARNIFTHTDIGQLTATSRQTVNSVVSKLRKTSGLVYARKEMKINRNLWLNEFKNDNWKTNRN